MKGFVIFLTIVSTILLFSACAAGAPQEASATAAASAIPTETPAPATPLETATPGVSKTGVGGGLKSQAPDLVEVSGVVKKVNGALVLIAPQGGGEFMLRFSENSKWADGVNAQIDTGNTIICRVKLEPTFTTPSQGEVILVLSNTHG
jgi:hypothetical protein